MKHTKCCPKCGSANIVRINGETRPYGAGNNIFLGETIFSAVNVHRYICTHCGFTEEWISKKDLERIAKSKKARKVGK